MELTHGYDVLVCTPRCLLRLLNNKKSMFDLKKMDHIIFDEFHILLGSYLKEVIIVSLGITFQISREIPGLNFRNFWFHTKFVERIVLSPQEMDLNKKTLLKKVKSLLI